MTSSAPRHALAIGAAVLTWGLEFLLAYLIDASSPRSPVSSIQLPMAFFGFLMFGWIPALAVGLWVRGLPNDRSLRRAYEAYDEHRDRSIPRTIIRSSTPSAARKSLWTRIWHAIVVGIGTWLGLAAVVWLLCLPMESTMDAAILNGVTVLFGWIPGLVAGIWWFRN